jgi:hypothetical protein
MFDTRYQMASILPFCTFTTCFVSFSFPWVLWLKLQLWSSGSRCELQKNRPQRHSTPKSLNLRLHVEQRSLFTNFFSSSASFTGSFSSLGYFTGVTGLPGATTAVSSFFSGWDAPCLNKPMDTSCSTASTSCRRPNCRRRTCT